MPKLLKNINNPTLQEQASREERRFCALLLKDEDCLTEAMGGGLTYEHFLDEYCSAFYKIQCNYYDVHKELMTSSGYQMVLEHGVSDVRDVAKFKEFYHDILEHQSSTTSADFSILRKSIVERHAQTQAYNIVSEFFPKIVKDTSRQLETIQQMQQEIAGISVPGQQRMVQTQRLDRALVDTWEQLKDRQTNPEKFKGILTGYAKIDRVYHGFQPGRICVFVGQEGGGKTTVMLNLALNMLADGRRVVYITVEADFFSLTSRVMTIRGDVALNRVWAGGTDEESGLSESVMSIMHQEREKFLAPGENGTSPMAERFHIVECMYHTPWTLIQRKLDEIRSLGEKIDVVFVDYLNVIGRDKTFEGRYDLELAYLFNMIQNYGKQHKIVMITAQQLKNDKVRELQKKSTTVQDFRMGTGDVSGTKEIAAAADYIFGILIDPATRSSICLYNIKARVNPAMERFMLAYDSQSGLIRDTLEDSEYQDVVGKQLEDPGFITKAAGQHLNIDPLDYEEGDGLSL